MKVIDLIRDSKSTAFSFEILPPLKGNSIQKVYNVIDKLKEFDPKYINITSHHSEFVYKTLPDGSFQKVNIRKRPGSVAIAFTSRSSHISAAFKNNLFCIISTSCVLNIYLFIYSVLANAKSDIIFRNLSNFLVF